MSYKKMIEKIGLTKFKSYYESKLSYSDIGALYSMTEPEISKAAAVCRNKYGWLHRGTRKDNSPNFYLGMSEDELIEEIKRFGSKDRSPNKLEYAVKKHFGSWSNGTQAAFGRLNHGGGFSNSKRTIVYLLDFGDYIKLGITQQKLEDRLRRFPEHVVLDTFECSLEEAISIEKSVRMQLSQYRFSTIPDGLERNGYTECYFKPPILEFDPTIQALM